MLSGHASAVGISDRSDIHVGPDLYQTQNAGRDWSLTVAGNPPCLYRFEVRPGDNWLREPARQAGSSVERSELGAADRPGVSGFDVPIWTAYQFRIEPGAPSTAQWVVLGDWHVLPDPEDTAVSLSSPWQLELRSGDSLVFDVRQSAEKPIRATPWENRLWTSPAPIARGVWHSLVSVAVFDWRPDGGGMVKLWLDGQKVVDRTGPLGYDMVRPDYFKFGIYRAAATDTLAVDYANVELTRTSLEARIMTPPPICGAAK